MNYLQKNFLGLFTLCLMQSVALGGFNPEYTPLGGFVQVSPKIIDFVAATSGKIHAIKTSPKTAELLAVCQEVGRKVTPQIVVDISAAVAQDAQKIGTFLGEKREAMRNAPLFVVPTVLDGQVALDGQAALTTSAVLGTSAVDPFQKAPIAQVVFPDITAILKWITDKSAALSVKNQKLIRYASDSPFSGKNSFDDYFGMTHTIYGNQVSTAQIATKVGQEVVMSPGQSQVLVEPLQVEKKTFPFVRDLMKKLYKPREGFAGVHTAQDQSNIAAVIARKNVVVLPESSADAGLIGVAHGLADETGVVPFISLMDSEVPVVSSQNGASVQGLVSSDMHAGSGLLQDNLSKQTTDSDLGLAIKETQARLNAVEEVTKGVGKVNENMAKVHERLEKIENKLNEKSRFEQVTQYVQENPFKVAAGAVVTVAAVYGVYRLVVYVKELRSEKKLLQAQLALQRA